MITLFYKKTEAPATPEMGTMYHKKSFISKEEAYEWLQLNQNHVHVNTAIAVEGLFRLEVQLVPVVS